MMFRCLIAVFALAAAVTDSEAGPLRRRAQPVYQYPSYQQSNVLPAGGATIEYAQPILPAGYTTSSTPVTTAETPHAVASATGDGLDEVNAKRAARGLRPFVRDEGLTQAARSCAAFRAERGLFGHTSNDFTFVPSGTSASSAGCAAYPASYGWMSCCTYEGYTYAGAAWVTGSDGKRYMHLFVR